MDTHPDGPAGIPNPVWRLALRLATRGEEQLRGEDERKARLIATYLWNERERVCEILKEERVGCTLDHETLTKESLSRTSQSAAEALRFAQASPWIEGVRQTLWKVTDAPFEDLDEAGLWWLGAATWETMDNEEWYQKVPGEPELPRGATDLYNDATQLAEVMGFHSLDLVRHVLVGGPVQFRAPVIANIRGRFESMFPSIPPIDTPSVELRVYWPLRLSKLREVHRRIKRSLSRIGPERELLKHIVEQELGLEERDSRKGSWQQVNERWVGHGQESKNWQAHMMCYRRLKGLA